jgi:hypothetical protein
VLQVKGAPTPGVNPFVKKKKAKPGEEDPEAQAQKPGQPGQGPQAQPLDEEPDEAEIEALEDEQPDPNADPEQDPNADPEVDPNDPEADKELPDPEEHPEESDNPEDPDDQADTQQPARVGRRRLRRGRRDRPDAVVRRVQRAVRRAGVARPVRRRHPHRMGEGRRRHRLPVLGRERVGDRRGRCWDAAVPRPVRAAAGPEAQQQDQQPAPGQAAPGQERALFDDVTQQKDATAGGNVTLTTADVAADLAALSRPHLEAWAK